MNEMYRDFISKIIQWIGMVFNSGL